MENTKAFRLCTTGVCVLSFQLSIISWPLLPPKGIQLKRKQVIVTRKIMHVEAKRLQTCGILACHLWHMNLRNPNEQI